MFKTKILASLLLITAVLFAQVGIATAAPQAQDTTPITGTIQSITLETDELGITTVLVTITDGMGAEQTLRLSLETAAALGLVSSDTDPVDETKVGTEIEIDPATVIPDEEPVEESFHPISEILAKFFGDDTSVIDVYHTDGFGFGVIAQSLWMSQNLGGDATLAGQILEAKQSGDYSALFPEGAENIPTNWGQFKKMTSEEKNNLGVIVSGHAENDDVIEEQVQPGNGHGNSQKDKDKENKGNGKGKDK
jgi:hypothetical protein